jgi:hypothetical protein
VPDIITAVVGSRAAAAATGATSSTRAATIGQRDATATILASMSPITLVAPRLIDLTVRACITFKQPRRAELLCSVHKQHRPTRAHAHRA